MDKSHFFWTGGIFAFASYGLIFALLILYLAPDNLKKIAIKSEQSSIEISMEDTEASPQNEPIETKQIEKSEPIEQPKEKAEQDTQPADKKIQTPNTAKQTDTKKTNEHTVQDQKPPPPKPKSAKDLLAALDIKKNSEISFTSFNSSGEVNEYLSNIAKMIKKGWSPTQSDIGAVAVVLVNIKPDGSFDFRIKRGASSDFNGRLEAYLKSVQARGFPKTIDGKAVSVEFNFKAKE